MTLTLLGPAKNPTSKRKRSTRLQASDALLLAVTLGGCWSREHDVLTNPSSGSATSSAGQVIGPPKPPPEPRRGMVWVEGGALVAGTPPDALPRIANEEIPGEQVVLKGYYIDLFPYPNEEGAIPLTNVTRDEAKALCAEHQKRLCSELEWERACKGPDNLPYEYGSRYDPSRCGTGGLSRLRPSGLSVGCVSGFGARDLHGGVWEWTDSPWGRGDEAGLATVRGGNAPAGELVGRCANAMGRPPAHKVDTVGFRCCAGPRNPAEVSLHVVTGKKLEARESVDRKLEAQLLPVLKEVAQRDLPNVEDFRCDRQWVWRPLGNEELVLLGGCAGLGTRPACGVIVARVSLDRARFLAWASSGHWTPNVHSDVDARDLWVFGGDELGQFRRLVGYVWGRVSVGDKERRVPKPPRKKGVKGGPGRAQGTQFSHK